VTNQLGINYAGVVQGPPVQELPVRGLPARAGQATYDWDSPDRSVRIHIGLEVVARIRQEILANPEREVTGILLGDGFAIPRRSVVISDFTTVAVIDSKYRVGVNRRRFEKALADCRMATQGRLAVVGFYRSSPKLCLDAGDMALMEYCFPSESHVALVVSPDGNDQLSAGFFYWTGGTLDADCRGSKFPFDADLLALPERPAIQLAISSPPALHKLALQESVEFEKVPEPDPAPPPEARPSPVQATMAAPRSTSFAPRLPSLGELAGAPGWAQSAVTGRFRPQLRWPSRIGPRTVLATLLLVGIGTASYGLGRVLRARSQEASGPPALALTAQQRSGRVMIGWNTESPVVANATRGELSIIDGPDHRLMHLDHGALLMGNLGYASASRILQIQLTVFGRRGSPAKESVVVVGPPAPSARQF